MDRQQRWARKGAGRLFVHHATPLAGAALHAEFCAEFGFQKIVPHRPNRARRTASRPGYGDATVTLFVRCNQGGSGVSGLPPAAEILGDGSDRCRSQAGLV